MTSLSSLTEKEVRVLIREARKELLRKVAMRTPFKVGDLVKAKEGARMRGGMQDGQVRIVKEIRNAGWTRLVGTGAQRTKNLEVVPPEQIPFYKLRGGLDIIIG